MTATLFLAQARHQYRYFSTLIEKSGMKAARVITPRQWPLPAWSAGREIRKVPVDVLVGEKVQERKAKGKYAGTLYELGLRMEILWMVLRGVALLRREQPRMLVMWNGAQRYNRILQALAPAGTRFFFFENGLLPDTTTLDSRGVNFQNSVPRDAAFYDVYRERAAQQTAAPVALTARKASKPAQQQEIRLPEHYIFIPFQVDRDTQVRLFSPWLADMRALFAVGKAIAEQTGYTVVFKEHPSSALRYPDLHAQVSTNCFFANGNSTQQLIEQSAFVITINSSVGLESLLLGKPVLTLGQAFFNIPGLVMHADSQQEAVSLVRVFPEWPLDDGLRKSFLYYLKNEYLIPGSWREADDEHVRAITDVLHATPHDTGAR